MPRDDNGRNSFAAQFMQQTVAKKKSGPALKSFPWGYTFAGQAEGVAFGSEWSNNVGGYATLTADSTGLETWDPVQTVGHFRSDGGGDAKYCGADLDLGGAYDLSGGFRLKIWTRLTQLKDDYTGYISLLDASGDAVLWTKYTQVNSTCYCSFFDSGASAYATATWESWTGADLPDWMALEIDVQPGNDEVIYDARVWNTDLLKSGGTQAMTASLAGWNPNLVTTLQAGSRGANLWTDDIHTAGFWIGAYDDAFPANPADI